MNLQGNSKAQGQPSDALLSATTFHVPGAHFNRIAARAIFHLAVLLLSVLPLLAANPIQLENAKTGNPSSQWDISGSGDASIQGFATDISVNKGGTVQFKIKTNATNYRLDIYRLGYYNGLGARLVAGNVLPSASLPQNQPNPITDSSTGLIDCGNWAVSASWTVPTDATSGVYIAKLVRADTGGASHIVFVVRDDTSTSDFVYQTSDTTWQAYNSWGGNSFYVGSPAGRAYKLSYNRPFITRAGDTAYDWLFSAEYPMIRWLEANGYDVTYSTGMDTDRRGNLVRNHKIFLSSGHDEYWSGTQRANIESARGAGVHLAFFSANEVFWKTRWENSIDGSGTPYRTLVCYKETHAGAKIDPTSTWTGSWRDPRFSPPADGGRPENALTGTLFGVNGNRTDSMSVPASYGAHRFWRNTSVATLGANQVATFAPGTLGYEWDSCPNNGVQPPGLMRLSSTTLDNLPVLQDYGSTYGSAPATHSLALYRHSSGALVFGSGTVQWSWGLDANHDNGSAAADVRIQQATVNLFADMGAQPATLRPGLAAATKSTDSVAPTSFIQSPVAGATIQNGVQTQIAGTATDSGGQVWGVEVSTDGGNTWQPAVGRGNWSYGWTPAASGPVTIKTRAVDDSGNLETPSSGVAVSVAGVAQTTIWPSNSVPVVVDQGPDSSVELGVKFYSEVGGAIKGIRFYKSSANTGSHVANLWSESGTLMASATFANETPSGWQQVNFATPVPINASLIYVASYHSTSGHYSADENYFSSVGKDNSPLHAPPSGGSWGANGVYAYGASAFPTQSFDNTNYWVDVVLQAGPAPTLSSISLTPSNATIATGATQQFTAMGAYSDTSTQNITSQVAWGSSNSSVATISTAGLATATAAGSTTITASQSGVLANTTFTAQNNLLAINTTSLPNGAVNSAYSAPLASSGGTPGYTWSMVAESGSLPPGLLLNASNGTISGTPTTVGTFNFTVQVTDAGSPAQTISKPLSITITTATPSTVSIWPGNAVPGVVDGGPDSSVELGLKFRADVAGSITGVRFYKASTNTSTHVGSLWSSTGTNLATATFSGESGSGWQQVNFATPVAIAANTVYVVSYHSNSGHYSADGGYFASTGVDNAPLHALASGISAGNGVYAYGANSVFPNLTWNTANYWVDVLFQPGPAPTLASITVAPASSTAQAGGTQPFTATGTYSNGSTQTITSQVNWASSNTAVATINPSGLASATSAGTTTISATMSSVTGNAALTVQAAALAISTSSLPSGTINSSYSAALAATGGTSPYTWSLSSGSLPAGLALNPSSGAITGTPTAAGTSSLTVQATDTSNPQKTAMKALTLTVAAASSTLTIWPASTVPATVDGGPDSAVELGVKFRSDVAGKILGVRFYKASTNTGSHVANLWSSTGTKLATATFAGETASGWQQVNFTSPINVTANTVYVVSYHTNTGHYSIDTNYFPTSGADNPPLHALANGVSGSNGVYSYGASSAFPNQTWNTSNYWVDVVFQPN